jgi:hypothetical protein
MGAKFRENILKGANKQKAIIAEQMEELENVISDGAKSVYNFCNENKELAISKLRDANHEIADLKVDR